MGKKDMTIEGFVDMMKTMGKSTSTIQAQVQNLQKEATRILSEAHKKGLLHGDLHRENMMVDVLRDASGKPIAWNNLQFIDFGKSKANAPSSDLQEEAIGLRDTFKLLSNYAAEPLSRKPPEIGGKRVGKCGLPTRREPPQTQQRPRFDDTRRNLFADSPSTPPARGRLAFGDDEEEEEKKELAPKRLF
jgi:serine/threonine protein kinase